MTLKMRKDDGVRLCYTDAVVHAPNVKENPGKVFAIIGPFDDHCDKMQLQNALTMLCRGFNVVDR